MTSTLPDRYRCHKRPGALRIGETVRRAFAEFLKLPTLIVAGFLVLAGTTSFLDYSTMEWLRPLREPIRKLFFRDSEATSQLLATIASSIITVTSITFSLLLLAVQQAAGSLTHQVYDQFLRRRVNQVYFGCFVGLAVYTLVILATVDPPYNPVLGAAVGLLFTIVALILLILLLYTTINQMRPVVVIEAIHDHVLVARDCQRAWLGTTRREPRQKGTASVRVDASTHGYVAHLKLDHLRATLDKMKDVEIVLLVSVGTFVRFGDPLAEVRGASPQDAKALSEVLRHVVCIELQRDLDDDPAHGIEQLATIGWTSVSTAKSNPSPGLLVIHSLGDILARWSSDESDSKRDDAVTTEIPLVYSDDVIPHLMDAFEALAVVASESMQPQTMAEIVRTIAQMFNRLPDQWRPRAEDLVNRVLSALGEHVLTAELDQALSDLIRSLNSAGRSETADRVGAAQKVLSASVGKIGSRATRVSARG